jgi:uncharacterized membrane protein YkvA (DUF1232 family)
LESGPPLRVFMCCEEPAMSMWKRVAVLWSVVKGDARLLWRALRHPQSPGWLKLGVAGIALYLLSPIDLIPDFLPLLGVVDDLVLVPLAVGALLRRLPAQIRADIGADAADPGQARWRPSGRP